MDRIDSQGTKSVLPSLKVRGATPVAHGDAGRTLGTSAPKPAPLPVATVASAGAEAPVDGDRVAEIRKAVEQGRYPVLPTRIADAMIAAGFLLRSK